MTQVGQLSDKIVMSKHFTNLIQNGDIIHYFPPAGPKHITIADPSSTLFGQDEILNHIQVGKIRDENI